eukprot:Hpha_TRINITY_DN10431_c0_g1::TRINITY_DN10431_c0_g1_i1::g.193233::m.193233
MKPMTPPGPVIPDAAKGVVLQQPHNRVSRRLPQASNPQNQPWAPPPERGQRFRDKERRRSSSAPRPQPSPASSLGRTSWRKGVSKSPRSHRGQRSPREEAANSPLPESTQVSPRTSVLGHSPRRVPLPESTQASPRRVPLPESTQASPRSAVPARTSPRSGGAVRVPLPESTQASQASPRGSPAPHPMPEATVPVPTPRPPKGQSRSRSAPQARQSRSPPRHNQALEEAMLRAAQIAFGREGNGGVIGTGSVKRSRSPHRSAIGEGSVRRHAGRVNVVDISSFAPNLARARREVTAPALRHTSPPRPAPARLQPPRRAQAQADPGRLSESRIPVFSSFKVQHADRPGSVFASRSRRKCDLLAARGSHETPFVVRRDKPRSTSTARDQRALCDRLSQPRASSVPRKRLSTHAWL